MLLLYTLVLYISSMSFKTNKIPVKRFVYKYLEAGNPVHSYVLKCLYSLLEKGTSPNEELQLGQYTNFYQFELPQYVFLKRGFTLSRKNINIFNSVIEGYIYHKFEMEIEANIRRSLRDKKPFKITELLADLCAEYNMSEEDLPYETIRKHLYRARKEHGALNIKEIKKLYKNVPPKFEKSPDLSNLMEYKAFMGHFNMSRSSFFEKVKRNIIPTEKVFGKRFVRIDLLPEHITKLKTA